MRPLGICSRIARVACAIASCCLLGCTDQLPALKPPKFDPEGAASAAMSQYDANSDGKLDQAELKAAPGINFSKDGIDADGNGEITATELSTMIQEKWIDAGGGIMRVAVEVFYRGKRLHDATVTFEPEDFLSDVLHPATGKTDSEGYAPMSMALEDMPHPNVRSGVSPGLFLVRISKEVNGKELIPAKYNSETTLGIEVATRASYMLGPCRFDLKK